jgi:2-dehydropantoate 2-reductase
MRGKYTFGFIGAGPAGAILAAHLANADHPVVLVDVLHGHMKAIRERGLTLTGVRELSAQFSPDDLCTSIEELGDKDVNVVFVAVKTSLLGAVVPRLEAVVRPGTTIVSLQNGMDTELFMARTFGKENVLRVVVNYAGNLIADGTIRFTFFNPPNYIGVIDPSKKQMAEEMAAIFSAAGMKTRFTDDIQRHVWEKVLLNSALSAVCALTRKTMAQIMTSDTTRALVRRVLEEGIAVAAASGIRLDDGFLDFSLDYLGKGGNHYPSMYFDLERGNPTEIDFINGKLVEYGMRNNVPTPYNLTITTLVKGVELPDLEHGA